MVNFEKTLLVDNYTVLFLHVLNRVAHVSGVCINAIHLGAKKDYQKYKYLDCNIPHEYLVQKSAQVKCDADKRGCHNNYKPSQYN